MGDGQDSVEQAIDRLVDQCRRQYLWFLRPEFYPATLAERLWILDQVSRHGDRAAFVEAARLREWLLRDSSAESAGR